MSGHSQEKSFAIVAETRRKWSRAEKVAVVAETAAASVSAVARRHGIASSLVFRWRRELVFRWRRELGAGGKTTKREAGTAFVPVALPAPATALVSAVVPGGGLIEIELSGGRRVRVDASVDMKARARVIAVLEGR